MYSYTVLCCQEWSKNGNMLPLSSTEQHFFVWMNLMPWLWKFQVYFSWSTHLRILWSLELVLIYRLKMRIVLGLIQTVHCGKSEQPSWAGPIGRPLFRVYLERTLGLKLQQERPWSFFWILLKEEQHSICSLLNEYWALIMCSMLSWN